MAIGADAGSILYMVPRQALVLAVTGAGIGLLLGLAVEKGLDAIFETSGIDVAAYVLIVPALLGVTTIAALIPARRASLIEPTRALRYQ
jgi:ABC-type antimicrobial peptide transport system permease subunit